MHEYWESRESGAAWEAGVQDVLDDGWVSREVELSRYRGRGLAKRKRLGRSILRDGTIYFQAQTTEEADNNTWPLDEDQGYVGFVELDSELHIVDSLCTCPAWEKDYAVLPNGAKTCKHIEWAKLVTLNRPPLVTAEVIPYPKARPKTIEAELGGEQLDIRNEEQIWLIICSGGYELVHQEYLGDTIWKRRYE